jgi:hypothetical protein
MESKNHLAESISHIAESSSSPTESFRRLEEIQHSSNRNLVKSIAAILQNLAVIINLAAITITVITFYSH